MTVRLTLWCLHVWRIMKAGLCLCPYNVAQKYYTYHQSTSNVKRPVLLLCGFLVARVDLHLANFPGIRVLIELSVWHWSRVFGIRRWGRKISYHSCEFYRHRPFFYSAFVHDKRQRRNSLAIAIGLGIIWKEEFWLHVAKLADTLVDVAAVLVRVGLDLFSLTAVSVK